MPAPQERRPLPGPSTAQLLEDHHVASAPITAPAWRFDRPGLVGRCPARERPRLEVRHDLGCVHPRRRNRRQAPQRGVAHRRPLVVSTTATGWLCGRSLGSCCATPTTAASSSSKTSGRTGPSLTSCTSCSPPRYQDHVCTPASHAAAGGLPLSDRRAHTGPWQARATRGHHRRDRHPGRHAHSQWLLAHDRHRLLTSDGFFVLTAELEATLLHQMRAACAQQPDPGHRR